MTRAEHYRIAEEILKVATLEKDCLWAQVMVTSAQAHATLASVPWEMEERK